jgi:glycosyltransferase involved in cell wall biosynthesis
MRVGYDARILASTQLTGIGRYTRHLIEAIRALGTPHRFSLFFPRGGDGALPPAGFAARVGLVRGDMREDRFYRLWLDCWLPFEIARRRIDLFHGPSYLLPRTRRARTVVTVHDLAHEKRPEWAPACSPEFARRARESARRADAVIAVSRATRRDVVEIYGVPEEKVEVIYEGVDPSFRPIDDCGAIEGFRARRGLPAHFILSVISLTPRKNLPGLMRAFSLFVRSSGLPHHLVVAGKSYGADDPRCGAEALGIADRFRFIEYVSGEELPLLYNAAELFVFPSFYEGFGLPPVEALACGCPVVSSRAGSLPEVLGDAARYFDPGNTDEMADGLARAAREGRTREARDNGLARAREFSWDRAARETVGLYERLL